MKALISTSALLLCVSYASASYDYLFSGSADTTVIIEGGGDAALGVRSNSYLGMHATTTGGYEGTALRAEIGGPSICRAVQATADNCTDNYAVYATANSGTYDNYAGYFNGDVVVYGTFTDASDARIKKNVQPLNAGLSSVMALKPKTYEMDNSQYAALNLAKGKQIGLIAQEVEAVFPELVQSARAPENLTVEEQKNGTDKPRREVKAVNYIGLIPVLIKAVQEQQAVIQSQQTSLQALQAEVAALKGR